MNLLLEARKYNSLKEKMKKKNKRLTKLKEKINKLKELINAINLEIKMIKENNSLSNSGNKTFEDTISTNRESYRKIQI